LIKKQIGLLAIIAFIVTFMAFSGVASAQTSNAQVVFFTSPYCKACNDAVPIVQSAAAKYGVTLVTYDVTTGPGKGIASANGVSETPTIVVSGAQSARFEGSITQTQIESAIQAAIGTTTPKPTVAATTTPKATVAATTTPKATVAATTTPKATATPTAAATVKTTTTYTGPFVGSKNSDVYHYPWCFEATKIKPENLVKFATAAEAQAKGYRPCLVCNPPTAKTTTAPTAQPTIQVATTTPTTMTSTQTVPEFSLLGLGAPALLVGAIYLFLRRQ
jgi:thiol-disulfide isomerase/thioredoxin